MPKPNPPTDSDHTSEMKALESAAKDVTDAVSQTPDDSLANVTADPPALEMYLQPWDRRPKESDQGWLLFTRFRDKGPKRTQTDIARFADSTLEESGLKPRGFEWQRRAVHRFATKFDWQERVFSYDKETERLYQLARSEEVRAMSERHGVIIVDAIEALTVPADALRYAIENDPNFIKKLSKTSANRLVSLVNQTSRTIPALLNAERLVRGMPTEIISGVVEHQHVVSVEQSQMGAILDVLANANRLNDGSGDSDVGEVVDAEVVEVHPVSAEGDDGFDDTGDNP